MLHKQLTIVTPAAQYMRVFQQSMLHRHARLGTHVLRLAQCNAMRTPREEAWHQSTVVENRLTFCDDPADFRNLLVKVRDKQSYHLLGSSTICRRTGRTYA